MGLRRLGRASLDQLGGADRDVPNTGPVGAKHHFALQCRSGIIEMQNDVFGALHRFKTSLDQFGSTLRQDLNGDIVGDFAAFDYGADKIKIRLGGRGKRHLDLFKAHGDQEIEHAVLALDAHRLDQGLIAVAQIDGAPNRRLCDDIGRPATIRYRDRRKSAVFGNWH